MELDWPLAGGAVLGLVCILQFLLLATYAISQYPGGTRHNRSTKGYSWSGNWLSDLGRTSAWNGRENQASSTAFNRSIVALGAGVCLFLLVSLRGYEQIRFFNVATHVCGAVAALGLVGIGLTPFDLYHHEHLVALFVWLIPMTLFTILFTAHCLIGERIFGWLIALASAGLIGSVLLYGLSSTTSNAAAAQKVVALISLAWLVLLVARVAVTAVNIVVQASARLRRIDAQAERYMGRLEQGHLKPYKKSDE